LPVRDKGLMTTNFPALKLLSKGKVRDIYEVEEFLLIVTTDRISAFDVIMPNPIAGKGAILTRMSAFWFRKMEDIIRNHLISTDPQTYPEGCRPYAETLQHRSMLVKKAQPLTVECIVRGYLSGSGWKDYLAGHTVSGIKLPAGLRESERLPEPIFTPSTKAEAGAHDMPMSFAEMENTLGRELARQVRETSLSIYRRAEIIAAEAGIIIADTKMEFGLIDGGLILIDELLTPDSSRFWPRDDYEVGRPQKSFDKQFLRDYLVSIHWDQKPPAPELPPEIIAMTGEKYAEALRRLVK
jgi:phosphoribosylaminoimidazole-succinocarboxamide synthase